MQSQSNLSDNYQEILNSLTDLLSDLDLKLTQDQYDDDLDFLKGVYLKVTLQALKLNQIHEKDLIPLDQLTKNDFLQAKLSYLRSIKSQKLQEQEIEDSCIDEQMNFAQEDIERYKNNQNTRRLKEAVETLKELKFIKSVSYALQQTLLKINNQAGEGLAQNEKKDMSYHDLINEWNKSYDSIIDIDSEHKDILTNIARYRQRNRTEDLQEEEKKLTLLLRIIAAKPQPTIGSIFSDQEELERLKKELEIDNVEQARNDLAHEESRRPRLVNREQLLKETDLQIQKIKRLIYLFELSPSKPPLPDQTLLQKELNDLCDKEEIKGKDEAESELQYEEEKVAQIQNKALPRYQERMQRIGILKRMIELFNIIANPNPEDGQLPDEGEGKIDIDDGIDIPEIDPKKCQQDSAVERARNAMKLEKDLPESFQKSINKVIYFSTLLLYDQKDDVLDGFDQTQMREQLALNLGSLINSYKNEEFQNLEVKRQILEVENYGHNKNELEKIIKNIKQAQIKHRFFNFKEFKELLSQNKKSAEKLAGKEITLLLGSTGCGKSTTVHYLCGSKMIQTENGNLPHIQPSKVINQDLKTVKCSPLSKSETRYVFPIQINLNQVGQKEHQNVILVDSPGSQDTESYEVDISNGLGIVRAVRQSAGVRLVILFSYLKLGARGEEIKKLIAFYAGMLKNLKSHLGAFSYCFTHIPDNFTIFNLKALLQDGFEQLTESEKQIENLVLLFQDIVEKACVAELGQSQHVHILRPLDRCPIKIHQSILLTSQIRDASSFLERIDDKGKFQVKQQFQMHSEAIVSAIKRNDGNYAIDLLEDLLYFQNEFPQDQELKTKIKQVVQEVIKYGQQLFKEGMQSLEKAFIVSEDNNLTIKDFQRFQLCFIQAKTAIDPFYHRIQSSFLKDKNNQYEKLQSFQYITYLRELLEESLEQIIHNTNDLTNPLWNRFNNKYSLALKFFSKPEMRSEEGFLQFIGEKIIAKLEKVFQESIDKLYEQTRQAIIRMSLYNFALSEGDDENKSPIELISENLGQLANASNLLEEEILKKALNQAIEAIQNLIKNKFNQIRQSELKDIIQVVKQLKNFEEQILSQEEQKNYDEDFFFEVTPKHVENITNFFQMYQELSCKLQLISGINSKFLQQLENEIVDLKQQLIKFYSGNEEKLKSVINRKGAKHRSIQKNYRQIQSLRRVPFIKKDTEMGFNDILNLFEQLVDNKQQLVEDLIPNIDQLIKVRGSKIGSPLSQLKEGLTTIMDLKDFFPEKSNSFFSMKKDDLGNKLVSLADKLKEQANQKQEQLCLEETIILKELDEIYQQLNDIQQISLIIECNSITNIDIDSLKKTIEGFLEQIRKTIPLQQQPEESKVQDVFFINKALCSQIKSKLLFLKEINQESKLIKDLGFQQESKNLYNQFKLFIEQNAQLQYSEFKMNLELIKKRFGLENSSKKEDDRNDNQQDINQIGYQVNNCVRIICDRIKSFKEIKNKQNYHLHTIFDGDMEVEIKIYDELFGFYTLLEKKMEEFHKYKPDQFTLNYTILTNLLLLDSFELSQGKKTQFQKIQDDAGKIIEQYINLSQEKGEKALQKNDYIQFYEIIQREHQIQMVNDQSSSYQVLQQKLQDHIKKLDKDVTDKLKFIKTKADESTVQELNDGAMNIINLLQENTLLSSSIHF